MNNGKNLREKFERFDAIESVDVSNELSANALGDPPKVSLAASEPQLGDSDFSIAVAEQFHGKLEPAVVIKHERAYHRLAAMLAAEGWTAKEIAEKLGFTPACIQNLLRQEWMQKTITRQLSKNSDKVLVELRGEALAAARRLIALSEDDDAPWETRRKANNDILNRVYGMPNQPITHSQLNIENMTDAELLEEYTKQKETVQPN